MATANDVRNNALETIAAALNYLSSRAAEPAPPTEQSALLGWQDALRDAKVYLESLEATADGDDTANRMLLEHFELIRKQIGDLQQFYSFAALDVVMNILQYHLGVSGGGGVARAIVEEPGYIDEEVEGEEMDEGEDEPESIEGPGEGNPI